MKLPLKKTNILIPNENIDLTKWTVIACDQYTSNQEYWDNVEKIVGDNPSTLRLTLPEIYLEKEDEQERINKINNTMKEYLSTNVLKEYKDYISDIILMKELAIILNEKRTKKGSINFDIAETKVIFDENGKVVDIKPYEITIANKIIEEFMLAANMQIAEKFFFLDIPFIYRIHEKPDEEKLRDLNEILSLYNLKLKGIKNIHPQSLSTIIDSVEDEEEKRIVSSYILRTLKLAKYSEECLGHFGLAAKYYCHFTSPIRRYPDLFIHRIISDYIESGYVLSDKKISKYSRQAIDYSKSSSEAEKRATIIERDFDDLYKCIYMSRYIGNEFNAVISNVTSFGIFVRLENTVEGLITFDNINDMDYYIYDEKKHRLVGKHTSKVFKIGDKLRVKLVKSDIKLKEIDFMIV